MDEKLIREAEKALDCMNIEKFNNMQGSVWECVNTDAYKPSRRDAFIGNGLIGMRIPLEGNPASYPKFTEVKCAKSGTQMYGLWHLDSLMEVFNFMAVDINHGRSYFARNSGAILNYKQTLDLKTSTVTTECDWVHWNGILHIKSRIYLSQSQKNCGCVELELTPQTDTYYNIIDKIDGSSMQANQELKFYNDKIHNPIKTVYGYYGSNNNLVVASSAISLDNEIMTGTLKATKHGFERSFIFHAEANKTYKIVKMGALISPKNNAIVSAAVLVANAIKNPEQFRTNHELEWGKIWQHRIEVGHNGLQKLINVSLYYLYTNLDKNNENPPGPTGLAGNAWGGHIFHDADLWTYPPILLLNPNLAKVYVNYRFNTLEGAKINAKAHNCDGAEFAWESAQTGDETIPELIYSQQRHINSDVSLSAWQYYLVTNDKDYLREKVSKIIFESANYWVSRVFYNETFDRYEILNVCCADEFACDVNNNAYTNYSAKVNLITANKIAKILDIEPNKKWQIIADKMYIPFDKEKKIIIEHDSYKGETIKQADAVLNIYPYEMVLDEQEKLNTVNYYRTKYQSQKIMMGSVIDGIIDCELGENKRAWEMLLDLLPHFKGDFLLASESKFNETMPFITGLGGFLQLVMMGFAGIRIHENELKINPNLPEEIKYLKLKNIHHNGNCFDVEITSDNKFRKILQ